MPSSAALIATFLASFASADVGGYILLYYAEQYTYCPPADFSRIIPLGTECQEIGPTTSMKSICSGPGATNGFAFYNSSNDCTTGFNEVGPGGACLPQTGILTDGDPASDHFVCSGGAGGGPANTPLACSQEVWETIELSFNGSLGPAITQEQIDASGPNCTEFLADFPRLPKHAPPRTPPPPPPSPQPPPPARPPRIAEEVHMYMIYGLAGVVGLVGLGWGIRWFCKGMNARKAARAPPTSLPNSQPSGGYPGQANAGVQLQAYPVPQASLNA